MSDERPKGNGGSLSAMLEEERSWLVVALAAGGVVVVSYYVTHPYPAYASALFLHMAELLIENGYRRPETVTLYTGDGVPFAYPPLMFYALALLIDVGIDPIQLSLLLPGILFVCALVPYFYLSREFLPVRQAGFATVALAVTPQLFRWHISGGGTVRAAGFLFVLAGLYVGVRLFKTGNRRLVLPGALLYGLTMLTHPVFTAYFGLSYLVFFAVFSRSPRGLGHGAAVAAGGTILGAPWWYHVSRTYGPETIVSASTTHGGLGTRFGGVADVLAPLSSPWSLWGALTVVSLIGAAYLLSRRRYAVPAWFVATSVVIPQPRFKFVAGLMLVAVVVAGGIVPRVAEVVVSEGKSDGVLAVALVTLVLTMTWFGGVHVTGNPLTEEQTAMPAYVDDDDVEAMDWVGNETPPDAEFVVLGDQAEWFPYLADRTSLVGPWGTEWTTSQQYEYHRSTHRELSRCTDEACITDTLEERDLSAEYVYVPNGDFVLAGSVRTQDEELRASMVDSERYTLVYENDGAMVFRAAEASDMTSRESAAVSVR